MAIIDGNASREPTKREAIDKELLRVSALARANDQAILSLRSLLLSAPPTSQAPDRPSHPGWLGEIQDTLGVVLDCLDNTAKVIEEISQQVAATMLTANVRG